MKKRFFIFLMISVFFTSVAFAALTAEEEAFVRTQKQNADKEAQIAVLQNELQTLIDARDTELASVQARHQALIQAKRNEIRIARGGW